MKDMEQNNVKASLNEEKMALPIKRKLPLVAYVLYGLALLSAVLYAVFMFSPSFADFYNRYVGSVFRAILAKLTGWIPFSLAEFLILLLPVLLVFAVWFGIKRYADSWRNVLVYCGIILSLLAYLFSSFALCFAAGYRGSTLDQKLGLEVAEVDEWDLFATAFWLSEEINDEAESITFDADGFSVMPYDLFEMNDKLMDAYRSAGFHYRFLQRLESRLKPVMLSELMSYTHITGVYSFFTGEANLNVAFPDYTIPFTAAHELAHQRGIARENEANFIAFLVCMESEDAYIRYSAYTNLYDYVISALYSADYELYTIIQSGLNQNVREERIAYANFFEQYADSTASNVSGAVNDAYLTSQGTEGTKSYGMVVDLAVAYWKSR